MQEMLYTRHGWSNILVNFTVVLKERNGTREVLYKQYRQVNLKKNHNRAK